MKVTVLHFRAMRVARLVLLIFAVPPLFAQSTSRPAADPHNFYGGTAQDLMDNCRKVKMIDTQGQQPSTEAVLGVVQCGRYLYGIVDGLALASMLHPSDKYFCLPDAVSQSELTRVVTKYGDDHPEKLHYLAGMFVWNALQEAYPCAR